MSSDASGISTRGILDRLSSKAVSFVGATGRSQKDPALEQPTILAVRASFASATAEPSAAPSSSSRKKNLVSAGTQAEPMVPPHVVVEDASSSVLPPLTKKGGKVSTDVLQEAIQLVSLLETQLAVSKQENQRLRKVTEQLVHQSQSSKLPQLSPGKYEGRQDEVLSMAYNVLERGDTLLNGYGMSGSLRGGSHAVLEEEGEDDSEVAENKYDNGRQGVYHHQSRGREREVTRGRAGELQEGGGNHCNKSLISRPGRGRGRDRSRSLSTDRYRERVSLSGQQSGYSESRGRSVRDERRPRDRSTSRSQSVERRHQQEQQHKQPQQWQQGRKEGSRNQQARLEDEYEQARARRMDRSQAQGRRGRNGDDDGDEDGEEDALEDDGEDEENERALTRWVRLGTYQTFKAVQDAKRLRVRKALAPPGRNITRRIILPSSVGDWPTVLHYKSSKLDRPSASLRGGGRRFQIRFDRARGQWVLEGEERWGRGRSKVYGGAAPDMTRDDYASAPPQYAVAAAPRIGAIPPSFSIDDDYGAPPNAGLPNPSYQDLLDRLYNTVNEMRNAAGAPSVSDVDENRAPGAPRRHVGRAPQLNNKGSRRFGHAKMRDLGY